MFLLLYVCVYLFVFLIDALSLLRMSKTANIQEKWYVLLNLLWGTVAHWLEHWTHDHKVVGTSHDSSSLC